MSPIDSFDPTDRLWNAGACRFMLVPVRAGDQPLENWMITSCGRVCRPLFYIKTMRAPAQLLLAPKKKFTLLVSVEVSVAFLELAMSPARGRADLRMGDLPHPFVETHKGGVIVAARHGGTAELIPLPQQCRTSTSCGVAEVRHRPWAAGRLVGTTR